jgi:hypothetical protein
MSFDLYTNDDLNKKDYSPLSLTWASGRANGYAAW